MSHLLTSKGILFPDWTGPISSGDHVFDTIEDAALFAELNPVVMEAPHITVEPVTRRQLLTELNHSTPRITYAQIEAVLPNLGLSDEDLEQVYIDLKNAQTFERGHRLVSILKAAFAVTDEWIDERWISASTR